MGLHAGFRRRPGRVRTEHLAHIGFLTAGEPRFEFGEALLDQRLGGAHLGIGLGDRELHALILANRAAKQHALLGIIHGLVDEPLGVTNGLG